MTDQLTPAVVGRALQPLLLLVNPPELTEELAEFVLRLLQSEQVTRAELEAAVVDILKTEKFWPGPAAIFERVNAVRMKAEADAAKADRALGMRMRDSSNRILDFLREHDRDLCVEVTREMRRSGYEYAQDAVKRLDHTSRVKALLAKHRIPTREVTQ